MYYAHKHIIIHSTVHARTYTRTHTHTHIDVTEAHCNALYDTNGEAQTAEKGLCG